MSERGRPGRIRVLIASGDARFVEVTRAVLEREGLVVDVAERPVGVVVVSENARAPRLDSFHPSPKWGSAQRLIAQVHEAYVGSDRNGGACLAVL